MTFFFYFRNWYFCRASIFPDRNSEGKKKKLIEVNGVGQRSSQVKIKESNKSNLKKKIVLIGLRKAMFLTFALIEQTQRRRTT